MKISLYLLIGLSLLCSCQQESTKIPSISEIPHPSSNAGEANLHLSTNGEIYLSWVEYLNDTTDALQFSKLVNNNWTDPKTIASGSDWFVNWADFPAMVTYQNDENSIAAHWLQKSASGTYDYDIHIAQSFDGGQNWQDSFVPHRDSIAAEHGFLSFVSLPEDKIFATWLDGRNTKIAQSDTVAEATSHGHGGAMTLRSAIFDKNGNLTEETELDRRICDCCQTSAALTEEGLIIAYRDRSENEIRDISIVRQLGGSWTEPTYVFQDNWKITACPVNGPAISTKNNQVAVAWFSMPTEDPQVKVSFSNNNGANFLPPIRLDNGNPEGRVDIIFLSNEDALVSWLEKTENKSAQIRAIRVNAKGKVGESFVIATTNPTRKSGFPKMVKNGDKVVFAWTAVDSLSRIKTGILSLP